jgi:hypothetical protein
VALQSVDQLADVKDVGKHAAVWGCLDPLVLAARGKDVAGEAAEGNGAPLAYRVHGGLAKVNVCGVVCSLVNNSSLIPHLFIFQRKKKDATAKKCERLNFASQIADLQKTRVFRLC